MTFHDIQQASFSDPLKVVVSGGAIASASLEGEPAEIEGPAPAPIETYFDLIEGWMDAGSKVDVIYHSSLGHPVFVAIAHPDGSTTAFSPTSIPADSGPSVKNTVCFRNDGDARSSARRSSSRCLAPAYDAGRGVRTDVGPCSGMFILARIESASGEREM